MGHGWEWGVTTPRFSRFGYPVPLSHHRSDLASYHGEGNCAHLENVRNDSGAHLGVDKAGKQLVIYEGHRREMAKIAPEIASSQNVECI